MGALLGLILPLVPSIISGVEAIFKSKPQSGTDKLGAVLDSLRAIISKMVATGIPLPDGTKPAQPSDDAIIGMIETVLQQLQDNGTLGSVLTSKPDQPTSPGGSNLYVLQGTIVPFKSQ